MVLQVASTRTLAQHFRRKHPDLDLVIKFRCEQCDIFVEPNSKADHVCDPVAARKIRGLYRHSKKRAARKLLNDNHVQYSGTVEDATTYFTNVFEEKHANANVLGEGLNTYVKNAKDHELTEALYEDITKGEIAMKLRSAANTAPGADRCEYAHLKRVDPGGKILAVIFNCCQRQKDVPAAWKQATTVLIYKKGDDADVSNFRPISLMSVIYKLFMGVMAKRLTRWSIDAGVISDEQKSARPLEGCYEHTYLLKSLVADSRRRKQKLFLAWLDIRNAFGSFPHTTICSVLRHVGVLSNLVTLILNTYTGATSVIRTPQGDTPAIPLRAGVKQGCHVRGDVAKVRCHSDVHLTLSYMCTSGWEPVEEIAT